MKNYLLSLFLLAPLPAFAARPMITDDARLTDAQACQLESWFHAHRDGNELWALPACNPGGNFELTMGGGLSRMRGEMDSGAFIIQGKTLFRPLETNDFGFGLAAGYATQTGDGQSGSPYFYIPASLSLADDRVVLHLNMGALHDRKTHQVHMSWGVGSETQATSRLYVIAESYGQEKGSPFVQLGLRYWVIPNRMQIDTTFGSKIGQFHDERWISVGLRFITPPLF